MATVTRCYEIANGGAFCTTRALLPEGTFSRVWDVTLAEAALIDDGALLTPAEFYVEDLRSLLVYDRPAELIQDVTLTIVDAAPVFETTTHLTTIDPEEHQ